MAEVNHDKLVKLVKSGNNQAEAARSLGITTGQLSMVQFSKAQVDAGVYKKIPATAASVKKARSEGNRWELIAARIGESVAHTKELFKESGGDPNKSYTGRGRDFSGTARKTSTASRKTGGTRKTTGSRKTSTASRKTATRRKTAAAGQIQRRRTRKSGGANPS